MGVDPSVIQSVHVIDHRGLVIRSILRDPSGKYLYCLEDVTQNAGNAIASIQADFGLGF